MKIIGQTRDGYIVEASEAELANAAGYDYANDQKFRAYFNGKDRLAVGLEIPVGAAHRYLVELRRNHGSLAMGASALRAMADALDKGPPSIFFPPTPKEPEK